MNAEVLTLDPDPTRSIASIREASERKPVLIFKKSPICPISLDAESEWRRFLGAPGAEIHAAEVDVIAERSLARGLTAQLGIRHESPQVMLLHHGTVIWHASHGEITAARLQIELGHLVRGN